ncbi:MAG: GNAT family N-acetyltransferase [Rhodospirillales bacterium]|nr:MAG: GNAT family N-acetyltransferase [Rhodospirillales bacterium]
MARASRDSTQSAVPRKLADHRIARPEMPGVALRALSLGDLRQVMRWLERPHVAERWGPPHTALASIAAGMDAPGVSPFIVIGAGRPVGFLQIHAACDDPFWRGHDLPRETFGLDLFIGETDALRRGHGGACLALAATHLLDIPGIVRVQGDPAPDNEPALRAFERAGFRSLGLITTPDGTAVHMAVERRTR